MKRNSDIREYTQTFYQHNRANFALALFLIILSTGGMLYFSWVMGEVTNIMAAGDLSRLWHTLGITVAALAVTVVVELLMYYYKTKFVHKALRQYKNLAFPGCQKKASVPFPGKIPADTYPPLPMMPTPSKRTTSTAPSFCSTTAPCLSAAWQ